MSQGVCLCAPTKPANMMKRNATQQRQSGQRRSQTPSLRARTCRTPQIIICQAAITARNPGFSLLATRCGALRLRRSRTWLRHLTLASPCTPQLPAHAQAPQPACPCVACRVSPELQAASDYCNITSRYSPGLPVERTQQCLLILHAALDCKMSLPYACAEYVRARTLSTLADGLKVMVRGVLHVSQCLQCIHHLYCWVHITVTFRLGTP